MATNKITRSNISTVHDLSPTKPLILNKGAKGESQVTSISGQLSTFLENKI